MREEAAFNERFSVYKRIATDNRLSHGAFRLWHYYLGFRNSETGFCFVGQRKTRQEMHCDVASVKTWTKQLIEAGYLEIAGRGPHGTFKYMLMDGLGSACSLSRTLPESSVQGFHTQRAGFPPSSVRETPHETNVLTKDLTKGERSPPSFGKMYPKEREALILDLKRELSRLAPSDTEKIEHILGRLDVLETQKFGYPITRPKWEKLKPEESQGADQTEKPISPDSEKFFAMLRQELEEAKPTLAGDRNKGTSNEGKSAQWRGVGKVHDRSEGTANEGKHRIYRNEKPKSVHDCDWREAL